MLFKSVKSQTLYIMQKWTFILTWYIVCGFVIVNFIHNIIVNSERQFISQMYDITKIITLSDWSPSGYFFMIYYPILVVLPTSAIMLDDRNSKMQLYLLGRMGRKNYYIGKIISVFISTFILFTLPFLMELLLEITCLHLDAHGDPSNFPYYQTAGKINEYFCSGLYMKNKILYAFVMVAIFGVISGILAMFNFAISTMNFVKYKIFTLIPVYLLLYIFAIIEKNINLGYTSNYMFILRLFNEKSKNYGAYGITCLILLAISVGIILFKTRRDDLK